MTTVPIIIALIALFAIAVVSPHVAGKVQRKANQKTSWLKRMSNWLWDPLAWWFRSGLEFARRSIIVATALGKKLRGKLPF